MKQFHPHVAELSHPKNIPHNIRFGGWDGTEIIGDMTSDSPASSQTTTPSTGATPTEVKNESTADANRSSSDTTNQTAQTKGNETTNDS